MNEMPVRKWTTSEELHTEWGPAADPPPLIEAAVAAVIHNPHAGRSSDMPLERLKPVAAREHPRRESLERHPWFSEIGRWPYRPIHDDVARHARAA